MLAELFRPMPLPRGRALTSLVLAGFAFLSISGAISFSTESPDTQGMAAATYWALFFAIYFVVLLGAALIGAFPRLARPAFKLAWLALVALITVAGLLIWDRARPEAAPLVPGGWMLYLPACLTLAIGLSFSELSEDWSEEPQDVEEPDGTRN